MKTIRLFHDHTEHRDGKVIRHKAGSEVTLPDEVADFIVRATLAQRASLAEQARATPCTPEYERDQA